MIAAALITSALLALAPAGKPPHPPGTIGYPDQLPPRVHSFLVWTELRALRFLDERLNQGDMVFGEREDAISFTDLDIIDDRNASVIWHVLTHKGDFTVDWVSKCRMTTRPSSPGQWNPKGFQIKCRKWTDGWSG